MDQWLKGAFALLQDPDLSVISAFQMDMSMGGTPLAAMGYVIMDKEGNVRYRVTDGAFGEHADTILKNLRALETAQP